MWQCIYLVFILCCISVYSFSPITYTTRRRFKNSQFLQMGYDIKIAVESNFETSCALLCDKDISLTDYMQLPVDQYVCIKMPLDASLERMTGSQFNMTIPPVKFFTLDVSPTIICLVNQNDHEVTINSNECILRGSPYVVGLNGCYLLKVSTKFTWLDRYFTDIMYAYT